MMQQLSTELHGLHSNLALVLMRMPQSGVPT